MIEQALRNEHLRVALQNYTTRTVSALDIDAYALRSRVCDHSRRHRTTPRQQRRALRCRSVQRDPSRRRYRTCDRHARYIPGRLPDDAMAMVVAASNPKARFYPNSWLVSAALDEPIGTIGAAAQRETAAMVTALNLYNPARSCARCRPLSTRDH
jgi:hypothetical protein